MNLSRKRRQRFPRCVFLHSWKNEVTGETGTYQCGAAGTNASQMCSPGGEHPPLPVEKVDEDTGWPILRGSAWTRVAVDPA